MLNSNAGTDAGDDERPQITTDGLGNWVAVWDSNENLGGIAGTDLDIFVSRSTNNGLTWTAPALLNTTGTTDTGDDLRPSIATDGAGNWISVWYSNQIPGQAQTAENDVFFARSTDNGATWSAPALVNTTGATDTGGDIIPRIASGGSGVWIVAWESNNTNGPDFDIYIARTADNGATWSAPALLNSYGAGDDAIDDRVEIVSNGAGTWIAAWSTDAAIGNFDRDIVYSRSTDNGVTWSTTALLDPNGASDIGADFRPALAVDRAGNWVAAWHATGANGADADIYTSRSSNNGLTWTARALLNTNGATDAGDDQNVRLTTDTFGNWVAVWESNENLFDSVGFDSEVFFSQSIDNGQTWSAPGILNTDAGTEQGFDLVPQLTTDRLGNWVAVWESTGRAGTDFDISTARFTVPLAPRPSCTAIIPLVFGPTSLSFVPFVVLFDRDVIGFNSVSDLVVVRNGVTFGGVTIFGVGRLYLLVVNNVHGPGTFSVAVSTASDVRTPAGSPLKSSVTSRLVTSTRR